MGYVVLLRVARARLARGHRGPLPAALRDRPAQRDRVEPEDVGPLGRHHGLPGGPGLHPLVPRPRPGPPRWGDSSSARCRCSARSLLTVMVTLLAPVEPAARHPAADDLHGRLQAGPPARADLGPDARLHDDRDGPRRSSSAASACSTSGGPSAGRSRRPRPRRSRRRSATGLAEAKHLRRAGRSAPDPDVGARAGQGLAHVPRLAGNAPRVMGIDVGQEQSMNEPRSHIEGATPATAIWQLRRRPRPVTTPQVGPRSPDPGRPPAPARLDRGPG